MKARWIFLPLVVLVLGECLVRATTDRIPWWYAAADQIAARGPIDVLFIGSSRVMAAVATQPFSDAVDHETGRPVRALNMARGYTTITEHYLGIRDLIVRHPQNLQGVTVFIEAPGGLGLDTRWTEPWVNVQYQLLVDLLQWRDLVTFWRSAGDTRLTKLRVTGRYIARSSALINRRERVREVLLTQLVPALLGVPNSLRSVRFTGEDLQGPGPATGIRADPEAVRAARALAQASGTAWERSTSPIRDWPGSVLDDLQRLVRQAGGHLVFFVPPESDVFRRGNRTALRQEDAAIFARQIRQWDACLVEPSFRYDDRDLPDLWHLRAERSPEFTKALASAWLSHCTIGPSSGQQDSSAATAPTPIRPRAPACAPGAAVPSSLARSCSRSTADATP